MAAEAPSTRTVRTVGARAAAAQRNDTPLAWLVFGDGAAWPVVRNVVLGRSPLPHEESGGVDAVAFDDPTMSRRHLLVDVLGANAPCFVDLGSRAGSHAVTGASSVNLLSPSVMAVDGVEVRFGKASVRWLSTEEWANGLTSEGIRPLTGRITPLSVRSHPQRRIANHR